MLTPQSNDVQLYRGNDRDLKVTVKNARGKIIDISAMTFRFTVKDSEDGEALIEKSTGDDDGIVLTTPSQGLLTISLLPDDTSELTAPKQYVYDLELTNAEKIYTVLKGNFNLKAQVSSPIVEESP